MAIEIPVSIKGLEKLREAQKVLDGLGGGGKATKEPGGSELEKSMGRAGKKFKKDMEDAAKVLNKAAKDYKITVVPPQVPGNFPDSYSFPPHRYTGEDLGARARRGVAAMELAEEREQRSKEWREANRNTRWGVPPNSPGGGAGGSAFFGGGSLRKILGWTMAATGGMTLAGLLGQGRAKYLESIGPEGNLWARGIRDTGGFGDTIGMGVGPIEYMRILERQAAMTGLTGDKAKSAGIMTVGMSRAFGVSPDEVMGLRSSIFRATGNNDTFANGTIEVLAKSMAKGMNMSEALQNVSRNTSITASALHGAAMSGEQVLAMTRLGVNSLKIEDVGIRQYAKSQEFANFAQNGFKNGTGSGPGDILLANAMSLYNGPMTREKIAMYKRVQQEGPLLHPDILMKVLHQLHPTSRLDLEGAIDINTPLWGEGYTAKSLVDLVSSGHIKQLLGKHGNIAKLASGKSGDAAWWRKWIQDNPAQAKQIAEAQKEHAMISGGKAISDVFTPLETRAYQGMDTVLNSVPVRGMIGGISSAIGAGINPGSTNPDYVSPQADMMRIIRQIGKARGLSEEDILWMQAVSLKESKGDPNAYNTNRNGTHDYGLFQINDVNLLPQDRAIGGTGKMRIFNPEQNTIRALGVMD